LSSSSNRACAASLAFSLRSIISSIRSSRDLPFVSHIPVSPPRQGMFLDRIGARQKAVDNYFTL
jgi:hypothetical protein